MAIVLCRRRRAVIARRRHPEPWVVADRAGDVHWSPGGYVTVTLQEGIGSNYISGIQATLTAPDGSTLNGTSAMDYQEPTYSFVCEDGPCCCRAS